MKRMALILMLLFLFNFSTPSNNVLSPKLRHYIEYTQVINKRSVSDDEILKQKIVLYMRIHSLLMKMEYIDMCYGLSFNTS
jgi:hypothetical protein